MSVVLEIGSKNYADDSLSIKKALSHMESLVNTYNGYVKGEPSSKFGWTFFTLGFKPALQDAIEEKFSSMITKYDDKYNSQKFAKFISDYFMSRGCDIKVKLVT